MRHLGRHSGEVLLQQVPPLDDLATWFKGLSIKDLDTVWVSAMTSFLSEEAGLEGGVLKQFAEALCTVRERMRGDAFASVKPALQRKSRTKPNSGRLANWPNGRPGSKPKLNEEQARILLRLRPQSEYWKHASALSKDLRPAMNVAASTITKLWHRKSWKHLDRKAA